MKRTTKLELILAVSLTLALASEWLLLTVISIANAIVAGIGVLGMIIGAMSWMAALDRLAPLFRIGKQHKEKAGKP